VISWFPAILEPFFEAKLLNFSWIDGH